MSPQDHIERVLKEIHVALAEGEACEGEPERVIVNRRQILELLDQLNQGIYEMLDQYEQTRESRLSAERTFKKRGDEIVGEAQGKADDLYAASVLYTEEMLGGIRELMDQTNDAMSDLFRQFRRELKQQKNQVRSRETELIGELSDLRDSRKYMHLIDDMNRERAHRGTETEPAAGKEERPARREIYTPPSAVEVKVNESYFEKSGRAVPGDAPASPLPAEKPDVIVNKNAAYFKWKAQQEAGAEADEIAETEAFASLEAAEEHEAGRDAKTILKTIIFGRDG